MRTAPILSMVAALALATSCVPDTEPPAPTPYFQVTSPDDTLDGVCDSHCTLRDAVAAANADAAIDEIHTPAGTYHVALTTPTGPSGEAYGVTDDLLVVGAGSGLTRLAVGGRDVRTVWRTTTSLDLRGLAISDVGSGTTTVARTAVAAPMAAADESVRFDDVVVDGVQPDMSDAGGNGAAAIITAGGASITTAHPFQIVIQRSHLEQVGRGIPFVNLGGELFLLDSTYDDGPAIIAGDQGPSANVFLPHLVTIVGSRLSNGTANVLSSCVPGVAVLFVPGALVRITASELTGGSAGPCGGVAPSGSASAASGVVLGLSGYVSQPTPRGWVSVRRSTIDGAGGSNAVGVLAIGDGPVAAVDMYDSTLLAGIAAALRVTLLNPGLGPGPEGGSVDLDHVTIVGPPAGPGYGLTIAGAVPVAISNSVGLSGGAFLCGPGTPLVSGGGNTFSDPSCVLGGPGDQTSTDPQLGPLGSHGGLGATLVPLAGSPLVDAAVGSTSTTDQRGVARPQGPAADRGAVERTTND